MTTDPKLMTAYIAVLEAELAKAREDLKQSRRRENAAHRVLLAVNAIISTALSARYFEE